MATAANKIGENNRGRPKGALNLKTRELVEKIEATGLTPLAYMLSILRDEKQDAAARFEAAKQAAPYCHAKLASIAVEHDVSDGLAEIIAKRRAQVASISE